MLYNVYNATRYSHVNLLLRLRVQCPRRLHHLVPDVKLGMIDLAVNRFAGNVGRSKSICERFTKRQRLIGRCLDTWLQLYEMSVHPADAVMAGAAGIGRSFDYDDILEHIGQLGAFQLIHVTLLCLPAMFPGILVMSYAFTGAIPKYR